MILHTRRRHGLRIRHVRVVSVDEDPRVRDILRQVIPRPEGAVLMAPCFVGVVISAAGVETVDEDETTYVSGFSRTENEEIRTRSLIVREGCIPPRGRGIRFRFPVTVLNVMRIV
jgi:hypothetical protein